MVNQQKGVQQDTDYSAVVVNDHNYASPSLYPKRVIETWKTYIGRDRYTYYHTLQRYLYYRQFLVICKAVSCYQKEQSRGEDRSLS